MVGWQASNRNVSHLAASNLNAKPMRRRRVAAAATSASATSAGAEEKNFKWKVAACRPVALPEPIAAAHRRLNPSPELTTLVFTWCRPRAKSSTGALRSTLFVYRRFISITRRWLTNSSLVARNKQ
jgi:hypothetical protein